MGEFSELPPELVLQIVSFLTCKIIIDNDDFLARQKEAQLIPDLSSINALSQTNTELHQLLDQVLYNLCASVEALAKLALVFAVKHGLEGTLDRLVAAGASLQGRSEPCRLLDLAAALGHTAMVVKLLGMAGTARAYPPVVAPSMTELDYAARYGHLDVVRILAPLPPSTIPSASHTHYLNRAFFEALQAGHTGICLALMSEGADINAFCTNFSGCTPLYYAATTDNLELVQLLLSLGADPNVCCFRDAIVPLTAAARNGNLAIARTLVDAGADTQKALLHCSTMEVLRFFLERGADLNFAEPSGDTPLHHACAAKDPKFAKASVELLLEFGASTVDKPGRDGFTPVDLAIREGYTEIVELLGTRSRPQAEDSA
ncbi:ANK-REP-REGION domain-containing protein [Mycena sanguinolenta]|uniref:ANK-REP-REGION domain-containing protein n=1 Tax=Mycena sanguinolenta TaxID=230812 RepID=A0A8H6XBX3_9AGAR|nr:ANK-REP-REGION domain-containing protein [Mycena sanguinolenta]